VNLFIFGAGYSGKAIARELAPGCDQIWGTTRTTEKMGALDSAGIQPLLYSGDTLTPGRDKAINIALRQTTHLVASIAPGESGDPVIEAMGGKLRDFMPALRWICYLSTVGVYGDHSGFWVDETTPCRPVSERSLERVEAELAWDRYASRAHVPIVIARLSGIYGPGRNALANAMEGKSRRIVKPGQVFNRIHVDDIAGAVAFLASARSHGIFNITDDEPAPPQDVVLHACNLTGIIPPVEIPFEWAEMTPMARSFYGENKRVSNKRLKKLGYVFRYPNYRVALDQMWRDNSWQDGETATA
jgi:nucleoside-diphosphate-sugar epimerase